MKTEVTLSINVRINLPIFMRLFYRYEFTNFNRNDTFDRVFIADNPKRISSLKNF